MITLTYSDAVDAIFDRINTALNAGGVKALIGYAPVILWASKEVAAKPDGAKYWFRVSQQTVIERQVSFSSCVGENGRRRYQTSGLVFVQLFCPKSDLKNAEIGRKLATIARDAFRGKSASQDHIVFNNVRINELPPELEFTRFNVVAEYEYDEIG